jgi:hypothetical protein
MLLVAENANATAFLSIESLEEVLESLGAKMNAVNSATDIIIVGDLEREKEFAETAKATAVQKQIDAGARGKKGAILLMRFSDFFAMNAKVAQACKGLACISRFDSGLPPPGVGRSRGVCFPKMLQSASRDGEGPILNAKGKPKTTGASNDPKSNTAVHPNLPLYPRPFPNIRSSTGSSSRESRWREGSLREDNLGSAIGRG